MSDPTTCAHEAFTTTVNVDRRVLPDGRVEFRADLTVQCANCGDPFRFVGAFPDVEQEARRLCTRMVPQAALLAAEAAPARIPGTGIMVDPPDPRFKRGKKP